MTMDDPKKSSGGWHYDPTITLGHLVTTVFTIVMVVIWLVRLEGRVDINAQRIIYSERSQEQQLTHTAQTVMEIKAVLLRIETKLDSKADKK